MARSVLTLAALAVRAVEGLSVVRFHELGSSDGPVQSALVQTEDGRFLVVRAPVTEAAELSQRAEVLALAAMTAGVRSRFPFDVTTVVGQVTSATGEVVVTEFVYGDPASLGELAVADPELAGSLGRAIGAIHRLPTSVVSDAGLPQRTADDARNLFAGVVSRAAATGLLPAAIEVRWNRAVDDADLWQFAPVVTHGSATAEVFRHDGLDVVSVTDWDAFSVGDPAMDLAWAMPDPGVADAVISGYRSVVDDHDRRLEHRATVWSELELARWLLHGTDRGDESVVDDAVEMLTSLTQRLAVDDSTSIQSQTAVVLSVDEVEELLERSRQDGYDPVSPRRSTTDSADTASSDAEFSGSEQATTEYASGEFDTIAPDDDRR